VGAGIAALEQFRAATERDALVGRLRKNVALRRAPSPKRPGTHGRSTLHGPGLHPGAKRPQGRRTKIRRSVWRSVQCECAVGGPCICGSLPEP
jgi:hypothetical protein